MADFDGGAHTSDGGLLLLREVAAKLRLMPRLAGCFRNWRAPSGGGTAWRRCWGSGSSLAAGYEDLNDHDDLWQDTLLAVAAGARGGAGEQKHAVSARSGSG